MLVLAEVAGDDIEFLLGSREIAGTTDIAVRLDKPPLGAAINGRAVGDTVSYNAPNGAEITVVIKSAAVPGLTLTNDEGPVTAR